MVSNFLARFSKSFAKNKIVPAETPVPGIGVGTLINGRYRLDSEIGRGGMGIVYQAHDLPNERDVALKIINLDLANSLTLQQFSREAEIAARLTHPHIVAVYESGVVETGARGSIPFIVMEWVQGTCLADLHGFTHVRIIDIAKQICEALGYAHNQGIVYRDLKPGNVMLEKRGFQIFVKLLDFGLACARGGDQPAGESNLAGSFFYLAPEVIAGSSADIPSDLYALGVLLYEMITGRVPFSDFNEEAVLAQHLEGTVAPPSQSRNDVPPALESIVMRLLEKDPGARFASALEVRLALEQPIFARESTPGNLPGHSVDPAGRANEIAQVKLLLESNRLVTLLGPDDNLALAVGAQLQTQFPDGVWWVELEKVNEPAFVLQTVAAVLGIPGDPRRALTVSLIEALRERNLLLILNHCGQLQGACAQLAETILRTCPEVHILATSHQPLDVPAEKCHAG